MDTSERSPANARIVKAPHGTTLTAKSWLTEAPMRMIMNNLDPDVAEKSDELIVYGGIGKAARNWECFDRIVETLKNLSEDETLLVQSGKPVGVFKTHPDAPRVLIANSNLVPHWATWEYFRELDRKGLMMYGQMTAGSWIYIGSQGIVQGTYETFVEMGRQHFGGDLSGKWILTAGLGGMGGAQPLASTMAGASMLAVEVDQQHIQRRLDTGYCDTIASTLDEALDQIREAINLRQPLSIGLLGNAADIYPELVRRGIIPSDGGFRVSPPLTKIAPAKAQAILDYRKANGAFKSVEELKDVKGIGAKRFEKLKPELTVAPAAVKAASAAAKPAASAKGEIHAAEAHVRK